MSFRLHIPGRDNEDATGVANPANSLTSDAPVSGSAELATQSITAPPEQMAVVSEIAGLADIDGTGNTASADPEYLPPSLRRYTQTTIMLPPDAAAAVESRRSTKRRARIIWLGYGAVADELTKIMAARDRRLDDRRLCVECAHAGPGWRCNKKHAFLTDVLQRCKYFGDAC